MTIDHLQQINPQSHTVLVVDDTLYSLKMIVEYLREVGFRVLTARNGESCLSRAQLGNPDLILLDVQMPGIDGFETCRLLKLDDKTKNIPVIFMTALSETADKLRGFEAGAVDYVTKPVQQEELLARVTTHLRIRELTDNLEQLVAVRTVELAETNDRLANEIVQHQETAVQLVTARDQAEAASRAKSTFLSTMSHELRTPLMAVIGFAEIMQEQVQPDVAYIHAPLEKIVQSSLHLSDLINDILYIASIDTGAMTLSLAPINIGILIEDVIDSTNSLLLRNKNQLQLTVDLQESEITTDEAKLKTIVRHLLTNAAKFTKNGLVKLSLHKEVDSNHQQWLYITVKDNGIGMSPEQVEHLFRPFTQADSSPTRAFDGAGLGLALSQYFAELLGGEISVTSQLEKGSTFVVQLPWQQARLKNKHE
ncbi:MAG: response regulator [Chloroflexota bacterium]